jgi:hypothetical protein
LPLEEIRAYFAGDKIVCLRCGRSFKALVTHLALIHEMTTDEYREAYGLPYHRGLTSGEMRDRNSGRIKTRYVTGYLDVLRANGVKARAAFAADHAPQRNSHLRSEQAKLNGALSPPRIIYGAADFDRYLQLIAGRHDPDRGRPPTGDANVEVAADLAPKPPRGRGQAGGACREHAV